MMGLFAALRDWHDRRGILREARSRTPEDRERQYYALTNELKSAVEALERHDRDRATSILDRSFTLHPADTAASPLTSQILIGLERYDEAEVLLRSNCAKYPANPIFAVGLARLAITRGNNEIAVARAAAIRRSFPFLTEGYAIGLMALRNLQRLEEAQRLVEHGMRRFPEEVTMFIEFARLTATQNQWDQALLGWDAVRARFDHASGYLGASDVLIQLGRVDEAEAILIAGRVRFPTEWLFLRSLALCAEQRGDPPAAAARWRELATRFPLEVRACQHSAAALIALGAADDAELVLGAAIEHFPTEARLRLDLARLYGKEGKFGLAADVFASFRHHFPDDETGYVGGG